MSAFETPLPTSNSSDHDNRSLAALSNEMVRLYKEQFGRGPTKVRSHFAGPDVVVCLLETTFTPAEKNLQAMGEHQRLRDMRMFFQYASAGDFTGAVERTLGRKVHSFLSGMDTNTDVACELFVLVPRDEDENAAMPDGESSDGAADQGR